jgi:hypothetical protein
MYYFRRQAGGRLRTQAIEFSFTLLRIIHVIIVHCYM